MAISMTAIKPFIVGVPGTDTGPENAGITATNQLTFATGRNSATTGRRNALVTDDVVFSIIGQAQTSTNSTSNGQQVALINVAMQENATNTTRGTRMTLQTVNTGTTTISNRLLLSDRTSVYSADTHSFTEKTGSFSALSLTTATATFTAIPVIPNYTAAGKPASGAVGQLICISNSPTVGGRMAFWDTTNARWSYVSDNSAV
jgi:hypothetical protein